MALEAHYLTSSDVARRLGVSPGTVRHYGEVLRSLGFEMPKGEAPGGEEAYLWSPELAEVARVAYQMARVSKPRLSFEEAVKLILYAAEVAVPAREGSTIPVLLKGVHGLVATLKDLPPSVEHAMQESVRRAGEDAARAAHGALRLLREEVNRLRGLHMEAVLPLREEANRLQGEAERLVDLVRQAQAGGWVPVAALGLLFFSIILEPFVQGGLRAILPYFAVLTLGAFMGWWMSR